MLQQLLVYLFQFLVFTVPLFFTTNTDELFEFNKMILTYALTVMIMCAWLLRMILEKKVLFQKTRFDIPILLFLASQILSTIVSIHPQTSILGYYSRFHGGLISTITYICLYYAFVSNIKKTDLPKIFMSLFSSALIVSVYGIFEHFGHSPSCLLITGTFDVSCWIQDVKTRVFATFGQPNWLAAYIVMIFPLAITLSKTTTKYVRLFYGGTSIALFLALLFTQSRSGFLGFCFSAALFVLGSVYIFSKKATSREVLSHLKIPSIIFLICMISGIIFGTPYSPSLFTTITSKNTSSSVQEVENAAINRLEIGGTDSGEIRKIVWTGALGVWKRYPIFGSGVETFAYSYYKDRPLSHNLVSEWDFLYNKAHNEYLNFLATTGAFGLATYLLLQTWFSLRLIKLIHNPKGSTATRLILLSLLAGYGAVSISNFFGFSTVMVGILFFLFPAFAIVYLEENTVATLVGKSAKKHEESAVSYIYITIVGFITVLLLGAIFRYWHADTLFAQSKAYLGIAEYGKGFSLLDQAIKENPQEASYYEALADSYSQVVGTLYDQGNATIAAELTTSAIQLGEQALALNPAHLNYYKTQIRIYVNLASIDTSYLEQAAQTTRLAIERAPTDAKLEFTLSQILRAQNKTADAIASLEKTVEMKPDYEIAWQMLADMYLESGNTAKATETAQHILTTLNPANTRAQEIATYSAEVN